MDAKNLTGFVDVLIAAWNRSDTVERALLSALSEPEVGSVIVIDDGSADDTAIRAERIASQHSGRVIVRRLPSNLGPAAARNIGIGLSTAPWIAVLDADDFFQRGRLKTLLLHAADNDFVADDLLQVQEGDEVAQSNLLEGIAEPQRLDVEECVLGKISRPGRLRKELGFLKPLMRRSFLDLHGLRYDESLRLGEDYALYARALALHARFVIISACGYVSVVRPDSMSGHHTLEDLERLRDVDLDLGGMKELTKSEKEAIGRHYRNTDARAQWVAVIDAVKARSLSKFVSPFFRSWTVSIFLLENLAEQVWLRSGRLFAGVLRRAPNALSKTTQTGARGLKVRR
jgi:succinoglycan biosynthesis protein ExoU